MSREVPLGYIFAPTDKQILKYLSLKMQEIPVKYDPICDCDVYNTDPQNLRRFEEDGTYKTESYYYVRRRRLTDNSSRPSRSVGEIGFWRTSGSTNFEDDKKFVYASKTALVFHLYKFNVHGKRVGVEKTNWLMDEFTYEPDKTTIKFTELAIVRIKLGLRGKGKTVGNQSNFEPASNKRKRPIICGVRMEDGEASISTTILEQLVDDRSSLEPVNNKGKRPKIFNAEVGEASTSTSPMKTSNRYSGYLLSQEDIDSSMIYNKEFQGKQLFSDFQAKSRGEGTVNFVTSYEEAQQRECSEYQSMNSDGMVNSSTFHEEGLQQQRYTDFVPTNIQAMVSPEVALQQQHLQQCTDIVPTNDEGVVMSSYMSQKEAQQQKQYTDSVPTNYGQGMVTNEASYPVELQQLNIDEELCNLYMVINHELQPRRMEDINLDFGEEYMQQHQQQQYTDIMPINDEGVIMSSYVCQEEAQQQPQYTDSVPINGEGVIISSYMCQEEAQQQQQNTDSVPTNYSQWKVNNEPSYSVVQQQMNIYEELSNLQELPDEYMGNYELPPRRIEDINLDIYEDEYMHPYANCYPVMD